MINNHDIYIIVATDENLGIGKDGKMPWHLKEELKYFANVTTKTENPDNQNMVIMGRTTWESIPVQHRPLKNRKNVVLTRNPDYVADGAEIFHSLEDAIASADYSTEKIFIIGGAQVFKEVMNGPDLDGIYLTRIEGEFECDTFFPEIPEEFGEPASLGGVEEDAISYQYLFYKKND